MNDAQTELKNGFAYQEDCKKAFFTNKPFVQIFINITNYRLIHDIIGYETDSKVSRMIADELCKVDSEFKLRSEIYYISGGQFRMITDQKYFTQTLKASEKINRDLKETYRFSDTEINLITNVCVARCPDDIKDIETMMMFGKDIDLAKFYNGNVLFASELYSEEYYQKLEQLHLHNKSDIYKVLHLCALLYKLHQLDIHPRSAHILYKHFLPLVFPVQVLL